VKNTQLLHKLTYETTKKFKTYLATNNWKLFKYYFQANNLQSAEGTNDTFYMQSNALISHSICYALWLNYGYVYLSMYNMLLEDIYNEYYLSNGNEKVAFADYDDFLDENIADEIKSKLPKPIADLIIDDINNIDIFCEKHSIDMELAKKSFCILSRLDEEIRNQALHWLNQIDNSYFVIYHHINHVNRINENRETPLIYCSWDSIFDMSTRKYKSCYKDFYNLTYDIIRQILKKQYVDFWWRMIPLLENELLYFLYHKKMLNLYSEVEISFKSVLKVKLLKFKMKLMKSNKIGTFMDSQVIDKNVKSKNLYNYCDFHRVLERYIKDSFRTF